MRELYIKEIKNKANNDDCKHIPTLYHLSSLPLIKPITFFVGENGTGKSTLLEAIAIQYGFNAEGGSLNYRFINHQEDYLLSNEKTSKKWLSPIRWLLFAS